MSTSLPQLGAKVPGFVLPAVQKAGEGFVEETVSDQSLAGAPFVLFFYPKDATSGCTVEVCSFGELHDEFAARGVRVIGVSRDKLGPHRRFIENQSLPYALASDDGAKLIQEWGLLINATMYGKPVTKVARTTFLVDKDGIVRRVWEKVSPAGHAREVLDAVIELL